MATNLVELKRDGRSYEMGINQLSTSNIGLIFGLDPKSIWLKNHIGNRCYFPVGDLFEGIEGNTYTLFVEGRPPPEEQIPLALTATPATAASTSSTPPCYGGSGSCSVTVLKAEMIVDPLSGKVEFKTLEKGYVDMKSSTANITYLQSCIKKMWGEEYSVVSNDGLPIVDNQASRGIKFWKVGNRRLYAVLKARKGKHKHICDSSSDSDADYVKKVRFNNDQLDEIEREVAKMLEINNFSLPDSMSSIIKDTFRCCICNCSPIVPPAIYARCCKRMVGCQSCIDELYKGDQDMEKTCPLCRGSQGLGNTMKILGLDEFLITIDKLVNSVPHPPTQIPSFSSSEQSSSSST